MQDFEFLLRTNRVFTEQEANKLYEAGFNNSLVGGTNGLGEIDVCWAAETREAAIAAATAALKAAVPDIEVIAVEPVE